MKNNLYGGVGIGAPTHLPIYTFTLHPMPQAPCILRSAVCGPRSPLLADHSLDIFFGHGLFRIFKNFPGGTVFNQLAQIEENHIIRQPFSLS
jgi:hypothetical protein